MSLSYNGTEPQSITWNGADVQTVTYNGVEVWSAHPPFLVRMRYDANEASHVKDISSRNYPITMYSGSNVPAAADPFGGNEAMNMDNVVFCIPASEAAIDGLVSTVTFWIKVHSYDTHGVVLCADGSTFNSRLVSAINSKKTLNFQTDNQYGGDSITAPDNLLPVNSWHFVEISTQQDLVRMFIDGVLVKTATNSRLNTYRYWKQPNTSLDIGTFVRGWNNKLKADIYDLCILNGVWHTENYNVPTAYI